MFLPAFRGLPRVAPGYLPAGLRPSKNPNKRWLNAYPAAIEFAGFMVYDASTPIAKPFLDG